MSNIILEVTHTPIKKGSTPILYYFSENGLIVDKENAKFYSIEDRSKAIKEAVRSKFICKKGDLFTVASIEIHATIGELARENPLSWEVLTEIADFEFISDISLN